VFVENTVNCESMKDLIYYTKKMIQNVVTEIMPEFKVEYIARKDKVILIDLEETKEITNANHLIINQMNMFNDRFKLRTEERIKDSDLLVQKRQNTIRLMEDVGERYQFNLHKIVK
jgi:hypothetical protein